MWKYYDFDKNWDKFIEIWYSKEVQNSLDEDITHWKEFGFFKNYDPNEPALWKQSKSMYWTNKIMRNAQDIIVSENHIRKFQKTMSQYNDIYKVKSTAKEAYYKLCLHHVIKDMEPKHNTIHSFIMPEAKYIFKNTMLLCAKILFPGDDIVFSATKNCIIIPQYKVIFDLIDYYYLTYDQDLSYQISQDDIH